MAARFCLQEEGGRAERWCGQEGQHVGQAHLQKSTGKHVTFRQLVVLVTNTMSTDLKTSTSLLQQLWGLVLCLVQWMSLECVFNVSIFYNSINVFYEKKKKEVTSEVAVGFYGEELGFRLMFQVYSLLHTLQASLGGRVRLMITGAAPVSPTILTFLRAALGCQVSHIHQSTSLTTWLCIINNKLLPVTSPLYSFMKAMVKLNVQLGAPCPYLETGQQVKAKTCLSA